MSTQVLSASIRSVQRAIRSWYNGAQICTMPPKVFDQMYDHILTDKGMEIFENDWKGVCEMTFTVYSKDGCPYCDKVQQYYNLQKLSM